MPRQHSYPLMLDVADRLIVIVGGGAVAVRKAKGLIECGANRVRCVALHIDAQMPDCVEQLVTSYDPTHLEGATLVFAATNDPAVNAAIARDARERRIWVNRADAASASGAEEAVVSEAGDFSTPARFAESGICVTVSASGNPALATTIRDAIRRSWDARWSRLADAMTRLRPEILSAAGSQDVRARAFRALVSDEAMNVLCAGDLDALRHWLSARHPELALSNHG